MASIAYTPNEDRLLTILEIDKETDTRTIASKLYGRSPPRYAQNSVVSVLNNLTRKVRRNRERFRIRKSRRAGPHPIKFWIETL